MKSPEDITCDLKTCVSPWYDLCSWLGVKYQESINQSSCLVSSQTIAITKNDHRHLNNNPPDKLLHLLSHWHAFCPVKAKQQQSLEEYHQHQQVPTGAIACHYTCQPECRGESSARSEGGISWQRWSDIGCVSQFSGTLHSPFLTSKTAWHPEIK